MKTSNLELAAELELPDFESLSYGQREVLAIHIRTGPRRELLSRLQQSGPATDSLAFVERWELETKYQELEHYFRQLCQTLTAGENCLPILEDIDGSAAGVVSARARLYYSPEGGDGIHGPVVLYHVLTLAEQLLGASEVLVSVDEISIRANVNSQLALTVWDAEQAQTSEAESRSVVTGSVVSNNGRVLQFCGVPLPDLPIDRASNFVQLSRHIIQAAETVDDIGDCFAAPIHHDAGNHVREAQKLFIEDNQSTSPTCFTAAWSAYVIFDMISRSLSLIRGSRNRALKLARIRWVPVPQNLAEWFDSAKSLVYEVVSDRRPGAGYVRFLTGDFRFSPVQQDPSRGTMAEIAVLPEQSAATKTNSL